MTEKRYNTEATESLQNPYILQNCIATLKLSKNKSFKQMALFLKNKSKIKNWAWPGLTFDRELIGKSPFDEKITDRLKFKWIAELLRNPVIFFREFIRLDGERFNLNRANAALIFLLMCNINAYEVIGRQNGKTTAAMSILVYVDLFRSYNKNTVIVGKSATNIVDMLGRFKDIKGDLPEWFNELFPRTLNGEVGKDNTTRLDNIVTKNTILGILSSPSEPKADSKPRGITAPRMVFDEYPFIDHVETFEMAASPAIAEAAIRSIAQGEPTFKLITTTPGNRNTKNGKYAYEVFMRSMKFKEKYYDYSSDELSALLRANKTDMFAVEYTWKQLGRSQEWYENRCAMLHDNQRSIDMDVDNKWIYDDEAAAFDSRIMSIIRTYTITPIKVIDLSAGHIKLTINKETDSNDDGRITNDKVYLKIYKEARDMPCLITLDTGSGRGGDYHAVNVINSNTGEQYATMLNNTMSNEDVTRVILFLFEYYPKSILVAELNYMGEPIVRRIREKTPCSGRLFRYKPKDYTKDVESKQSNGNTRFEIKRSKDLIYGINTTFKNRDIYFDILRENLMMSPDHFKSKELEEQISKMILKQTDRSERIDHPTGGHDDLVISYCLGIYAIRYHRLDIDALIVPMVTSMFHEEMNNARTEFIQEHTIFAKDPSIVKTLEMINAKEFDGVRNNNEFIDMMSNSKNNLKDIINGNTTFDDINTGSRYNTIYTALMA